MRSHRECQAHVHPAGVTLDRSVEEVRYPGERHDFVERPARFHPLHPEDRAIQVNILAPREFRMKTSAYLKKAGHPPAQFDPSLAWFRNPAQYL